LELDEEFDVVIVDAGLAGLTSTIRLAKSGIKLLLIEKQQR
jgi:flavin-dependent dehydrogenase